MDLPRRTHYRTAIFPVDFVSKVLKNVEVETLCCT